MERESEETNLGIEESEQIFEEKEPSVEEEEEVDPRTLLTKEQVEYYKQIFETFDINKKERISTKTIGVVLRLMGLNPTKAQIRKHIQEIDPDNKGLIDFQSFLLPIAQRINDEPEPYEDIIEAFKVLDEDDKEFISSDELYEYLTTLGEDLEDFEIDLLLKMAETKGTNRIYYVQFVEKMMGIVRKSPKKDKKDKKDKKEKKGKKKK